MIKEIKAYKLSDGRIVEYEHEAYSLQINILMKEALKEFCSSYIGSGNYMGSGYDHEDIANELFDHRQSLYEILDYSHWKDIIKGAVK